MSIIVTDYTKLNAETFAKQVCQYGWISDQIPPCFTANQIIEHFNDILLYSTINPPSEKRTYLPTLLSTYKDDLNRRIISLPNLEGYMHLIIYMKENWNTIVEYAKSRNSLSPITFIHDYEFGKSENINDTNVRDFLHAKSSLIATLHDCIKYSLGFRYQLKIDIANCYESIYTHSLAWAILGKSTAKENMRRKKHLRDALYLFADNMDKLTRKLKNDETNGILVGPFSSRIYSELVLSGMDKELRNQKFMFKRYVDDYKFYFRSESEAMESIVKIQKIFNNYNLNINQHKTELKKYPYELISSINKIYKDAYKENDIFGVLNAASSLAESGEKGAFKYALKYISKLKIKTDQKGIVLASLINIILVDPKYGKYVANFLINNIESFNKDKLASILNSELKNYLSLERDQESLWFLYMIKRLRLNISGINVQKSIEYDNDYIRIMALDIWKNDKTSVHPRSRTESMNINNAIEILAKKMEQEDYSGAHWLLLYEIEASSLISKLKDGYVYTPPKKPPFWAELLDRNIKIYDGCAF